MWVSGIGFRVWGLRLRDIQFWDMQTLHQDGAVKSTSSAMFVPNGL